MCSPRLHVQQRLGAETPSVEQVRGPLAPSLPGSEQMTREGRKEGGPPPCPRPATLPDIIPSVDLLNQAPCEPPLPLAPLLPGLPLYSQAESRPEVSQGPRTQPSWVACGQSSADVSPS